jgi:hypothetical protein
MAALKKRWTGAVSSVYTLETNWAPISLRSPVYKWTVSGSGTSEYYLELIGGGNPGISIPPAGGIYLNGASVSSQSLGSLTAAHYGYGDNDTLGYSTIYVRTSGSVDPDTLALDYVQLYQIPVATDHVRIPAGTVAITGVDQSSVAIGDFVVEDGYTGTIGSATLPLSIDPDLFDYSGGGAAYINSIGAIAHDVRKTVATAPGTMGLYLTLTAGTTLTVSGGTVGLAMLHGQTSSCTTVRVTSSSAILWLGKGVTNTTSYMAKGKLYQNCAGTNANIWGGTFTSDEIGAITNVNAYGTAKLILNSTGTVAVLTMDATFTGIVDLTQSSEARTYSSIVQKGGTLLVDKDLVTVSAATQARSGPQKIVVTAA